MTHVTVPPILSFRSRYSPIILAIRLAASLFGQRTGRKSGLSTYSRVIELIRSRKTGFVEAVGWVAVGGKRCSLPTDDTCQNMNDCKWKMRMCDKDVLTKATISTLYISERHLSAMAPAATRAMVSLALLLPPPLLALIPYFIWYVQSCM